MSDHRKIQRTLFRMQADPSFAARLRSQDPKAVATTGLTEADLGLLLDSDPAGIQADPGGKRRAQFLGNLASEFTSSLVAAGRTHDAERLLTSFLQAPEFHTALIEDRRLPLALGDYLERFVRSSGHAELAGIVALEYTMVRTRRHTSRQTQPLGPGEVVLAPGASVVELPAGTLAWASALRRSIEAGAEAPPPSKATPEEEPRKETVLFFRRPSDQDHVLQEIQVERLEPPADELLEALRRPLGRDERARFARAQGAEPEQLEDFLAAFLAEGALVSGPA